MKAFNKKEINFLRKAFLVMLSTGRCNFHIEHLDLENEKIYFCGTTNRLDGKSEDFVIKNENKGVKWTKLSRIKTHKYIKTHKLNLGLNNGEVENIHLTELNTIWISPGENISFQSLDYTALLTYLIEKNIDELNIRDLTDIALNNMRYFLLPINEIPETNQELTRAKQILLRNSNMSKNHIDLSVYKMDTNLNFFCYENFIKLESLLRKGFLKDMSFFGERAKELANALRFKGNFFKVDGRPDYRVVSDELKSLEIEIRNKLTKNFNEDARKETKKIVKKELSESLEKLLLEEMDNVWTTESLDKKIQKSLKDYREGGRRTSGASANINSEIPIGP